MESRWQQHDLDELASRYDARGIGRDVTELVYASRLLGRDPRLVLHGGGNTSVKTTMIDVTGDRVDVVCVKGSGWDLATIEPEGLPAIRLAPLRAVATLETLGDPEMVNAVRCSLLDSTAPTPSVETLLHAGLPYTFILHTHANAVLALTDQPDGAALSRDVYGDLVTHVDYVMPGFDLARVVLAAGCGPEHHGMVLLKHGIFSFGATGQEAYERMIDLVSRAERRLERDRAPLDRPTISTDVAGPATIAPILRGACVLRNDDGAARPFILTHRGERTVLDYLERGDVMRISQVGVATPDHVLRTKRLPVVLDAPRSAAIDEFEMRATDTVREYEAAYRAYFARNDEHLPGDRTMLDPIPRVILVRGVGLFALGKTAREANIVADIAEATIDVITDAEAIGRFAPIDEAETFEVEYWSLEQAKLAKAVEGRLTRRVVVITGGAGTIGRATGAAFARHGADVVLLDLDGDAAHAAAAAFGGFGLACDVTRPDDVDRVFDEVVVRLGGVDIVVSNAGAAWQGRIGDVDDTVLRRSFELNFFAHQTVARRATQVMTAQAFGGVLLFNVSKQAVNPGRDFGPYGLPKAALMALVRQYAVDYGAEGIRSCGVNADRIRSGLLTNDMIAERSKVRQVTEDAYMSGNLLGREVTADDVADAFVSLALASRTTGAVLTVDGGNIAAALR